MPPVLHFPYVDLSRKQVVKQADLVLAMHLRGDSFTAEQKARNFAYYEGLTVRDSSLSACTLAVLAAEVGHLRLAHDYLAEAALIDFDNLEHNTRDGLHIASLAGTWIALVAGLAGMCGRSGTLHFSPRLPEGITRLAVTMAVRRRRLHIEIDAGSATYQLLAGEPMEVHHEGEAVTVTVGESMMRPNGTAPRSDPPTQPIGREPRRHRPGS